MMSLIIKIKDTLAIMALGCFLLFSNTATYSQVSTGGGIKPPTPSTKPAVTKPECKLGTSFNKSICSDIENNSSVLLKNQFQRKSGENSAAKIKEWVQKNYDCITCKEEPGFSGGSVLRKVVFENSLGVAFMMVYEMQVNMNTVEEDGRTLMDWLQDETERIFDELFETEMEDDKKWLMEAMNNNLKFYNLFKNNGAKFTHELVSERGQQIRDEEEIKKQ